MVKVTTMARWGLALALAVGYGAGCSDSSDDAGGGSSATSNGSGTSSNSTSNGTSQTSNGSGTSSTSTSGGGDCGDGVCDDGENVINCREDCGMGMTGGTTGGMTGGTCETDADCAMCMAGGELGCSCSETPMGNRCVPNCNADADCPEGPNGATLSCDDGVCGPGGMMMGGECGDGTCDMDEDAESCPDDCDAMMGGTCETDDDCVGDACRGDNGCTCVESPMGTRCAPNCETDDDCPETPNGVALTCDDGVCGRAMAMGECGDGVCDAGETLDNCAEDCAGMDACGDDFCDEAADEDAESCPEDCSTGECGDGACNIGETIANCSADCYLGGTGGGACDAIWQSVNALYDDVTLDSLGSCQMSGAARDVIESLVNLEGVQIDNDGQTLEPCLQWRCDADHIYVATTALPHYDFVATTPNPLQEVAHIYRIPLAPERVNPTGDTSDDAAALANTDDGDNLCAAAYAARLRGGAYTDREPGGLCYWGAGDRAYLSESLSSGDASYRKIPCLDTMIMSVNGVPGYGPNEGPMPDPYGTPFFASPPAAGESARDALLDLCFAHTANAMHHHGYFDACFDRDADGAPGLSYAAATSTWDLAAAIGGGCTEESPIVAWSIDGYPVKGPCVCTARNDDGTCATLKRVRSSWVYQGLKAWGDGAGEAAVLGAENTPCEADADCSGDGVDYFCRDVVYEGEGGMPDVGRRCVQAEYSWCSHRYVDHTRFNVADEDFVLLDRCNGYEGPDGYAYFATPSFPYVPACYRAEPSDSFGRGATGGGGMMMGGDCNNNGVCDDGEDPMTCPDDCGGMMGGVGEACETADDCACDGLPLGCACGMTPMGDTCIPACETADDCPTGMGREFTCNMGICRPQRM